MKNVILIVDDDHFIRNMFTSVLEAGLSNVIIIVAEDGEDGLEKYLLHQQSVCLVISDLMMPKMDGTEMIKRIRVMDRLLPIMSITGYGQHIPTEANLILQKPVGMMDLISSIIDLAPSINASSNDEVRIKDI